MEPYSNREKYINFYTDFAFKRLFGTEGFLQEEIFSHLFDAAEIARFTPQEVYEYEESLKIYRDWYSITKTAVDKAERKGRAEGRAEGREEESVRIAKIMKEKGADLNFISEVTGLSISEIENF